MCTFLRQEAQSHITMLKNNMHSWSIHCFYVFRNFKIPCFFDPKKGAPTIPKGPIPIQTGSLKRAHSEFWGRPEDAAERNLTRTACPRHCRKSPSAWVWCCLPRSKRLAWSPCAVHVADRSGGIARESQGVMFVPALTCIGALFWSSLLRPTCLFFVLHPLWIWSKLDASTAWVMHKGKSRSFFHVFSFRDTPSYRTCGQERRGHGRQRSARGQGQATLGTCKTCNWVTFWYRIGGAATTDTHGFVAWSETSVAGSVSTSRQDWCLDGFNIEPWVHMCLDGLQVCRV